jgi:hypothetical protein
MKQSKDVKKHALVLDTPMQSLRFERKEDV